MTGKKRIFNILLSTLLLSSCVIALDGCSTSAYSTYDYNYSIMDIQKAVVENLPQGMGATNPNRRVFYSKKFSVSQDKKGKIPLIMRIVINGDRRPYGLDVEVRRVSAKVANIEEAFDYGTDFKGQISLAKRVVSHIEDQLAQRRKNKNLFDDFRPF